MGWAEARAAAARAESRTEPSSIHCSVVRASIFSRSRSFSASRSGSGFGPRRRLTSIERRSASVSGGRSFFERSSRPPVPPRRSLRLPSRLSPERPALSRPEDLPARPPPSRPPPDRPPPDRSSRRGDEDDRSPGIARNATPPLGEASRRVR